MADETQWYILDDGNRERGPFDAPQVLSMVADGQIAPESFCWREGMDGWTPLAEVDLFAITLVLSVASRRHLRALPAPQAAPSPRTRDQPKPTPTPTAPREMPPPSRSTRKWLGTWVVLLLSAGAGVGLWWYKPWARGQAERRQPSAETAPARTAAPSPGTADALGRAVFNCLVSGDERAFAKTFMDPDTMRAYLKDQARRGGRFRNGDFDQMALAAFEEGYSYNRQQYLDAFRAARKRGRDDGVDWSRSEIKDVKVYLARADATGQTAERVRIRFQSPAGWHSVAIGSCVQTPMGWRVKVTTLVGPQAIAPVVTAPPPSPPPSAPIPTVVAWVKEGPPGPADATEARAARRAPPPADIEARTRYSAIRARRAARSAAAETARSARRAAARSPRSAEGEGHAQLGRARMDRRVDGPGRSSDQEPLHRAQTHPRGQEVRPGRRDVRAAGPEQDRRRLSAVQGGSLPGLRGRRRQGQVHQEILSDSPEDRRRRIRPGHRPAGSQGRHRHGHHQGRALRGLLVPRRLGLLQCLHRRPGRGQG